MKIKIITSVTVLTLALAAFVLASCSTSAGNGNVNLAKNANLRENVYHQILSDTTLFNGFMNTMMNSPQSMTLMMNNPAMMHYMFSNNNLQYIMRQHAGMNGYMMQNMMNVASGDTALTNQWNNMMIQHRGGMMMNH